MDCPAKSTQASTAATPCFTGAIRRKQQVSGATRELQLNARPEPATVGDVGGVCAAQVRGGCHGMDPVYRRRGIDHCRNDFAAFVPSSTHVSDRVGSTVGAVKSKDEVRAWQQGQKGRFIEHGARDMQCLLVAYAQESREIVPCPGAEIRNGSQEFRSAGFDAAAVRCDQQTPLDACVTKRNSEIPARNIAPVEHFLVTARFSQRTQ